MDWEIDGNPGAIRSRASLLRQKGSSFQTVADALTKVTTDGWTGRAADRFRDKFDAEPNRWRDAGDGFVRAAGALEAYAAALDTAKAAAAAAKAEYERGDRVTHDARSAYDSDIANTQAKAATARAAGTYLQVTILPFSDPGAAVRSGAIRQLNDARSALKRAAHECAGGVRAGCAGAPGKRNWFESGAAFVGGILQGAGEAIWDLGEMAWNLSPQGMLISDLMSNMTPEELAAKHRMQGETALAMLKAIKDDPVGFGKNLGKSLLDWDTWADDPARAIGHLLPDLVVAIATGGAGAAVTRGGSALGMLGRHADDLLDFRHLDDASDLTHLDDLASWSGEGLALSPEANAAANSFLRGAARAEPQITADMRSIADRSGGALEGLDYRLKGEESLKRKLATDVEFLNQSPDEALKGMGDSVRYTYKFDSDSYADGVSHARDEMRAAGYTELKWKNSWGSDGYQGVNSVWSPPHGAGRMEVQFHTPESFDAKMQTHELYEEQRLPSTSAERSAQLDNDMAEIFGQVSRPQGAGDLTASHTAPVTFDWGRATGGAVAAQTGTGIARFETMERTQ